MHTRRDPTFTPATNRPGNVVPLFGRAVADDSSPNRDPRELWAAVDLALEAAGLDDVRAIGVVSSLRRAPGWCSFDLAQQRRGPEGEDAAVAVVLVGPALAELDAALDVDGCRLHDGVVLAVGGTLRADPPVGGLRLVARSAKAMSTLP